MNNEKVLAARDRFFRENSFSLDGYSAPRFRVQVGPLPIVFPNPKFLHLHDLHHVATGFDTSLVGEAEISCYELRGGCRSALIHLLCFGSIFFAAFIAPKRLMRAWRRSRGARTLYYTKRSYDELLAMPVSELRKELGLPPSGLSGAVAQGGEKLC